MFKEKTSKKRIHIHESSKDTTTLDARHTNMLQTLQDNKASITDLYKSKIEIENKIKEIEGRIFNYKSEGDIESELYNSEWLSNITYKEKKTEIE